MLVGGEGGRGWRWLGILWGPNGGGSFGDPMGGVRPERGGGLA